MATVRHIENPGMVRTVYLGIFRHIQGHSAIFSLCSGILSHIQVLLRRMESHILRHKELCVTLKYTTASYSEPWLIYNLRHLQKFVKHIRWLFKHFKGYLGIFRVSDAYSATLTGVQLEGEGRPPLPFLKIERRVLILERKTLIVSILGLNCPCFKCILEKKLQSISLRCLFFCVFDEIFIEVP